ncbi:hypothetical protein R3P38DRAFT_3226093 [Favolaschia claudopus]|uniref:Uncharacterized protein n=1 Tax=Favolaschia claudopus TaxID=2862362 RepID=A0AAV9ZVN4_9AGAR
MPSKSVDGHSTKAQLQAATRYRERNKEVLREKARERMARRRAKLADGSEGNSHYQQRARAASARYRLKNRGRLASRQADRRALEYIKENGVHSWLDRKQSPPTRRKSLGDDTGDAATSSASSSSTSSSSEDEGRGACSSTHQRKKRVVRMSYEEEVDHFLDHCDPTTAPDYVPLPGQTRFFQRGKWRWY